MPTARPIIIEKFIDQTEVGLARPMRCSTAKLTAMPAMASTSGRPAAMRAPNAMSSSTTVGIPEISSARCSASAFDWLKSRQTAHSPVTATVAPSGTDSVST